MPLNINLHRKEISLSVSELAAEVEFLGMSGLAAVNQRLASGREQHEVLQQKRSETISGYQSEAVVQFRWPFKDFTFIIQGRIDGIYEADGSLVVEEIKTVILSESQFSNLSASSYPNYLNQVRIYCYLLEQSQALPCQGRLHFINLTNNTEVNLPADYDADSVQQYAESRFAEILADVEERQRWQHERLVMADKLVFPFSGSRRYQDELIDTVGGALFGAADCLISAPTGIGKTAGALFPALQFALATGRRIFYVTSKTTQQKIVQETLAQFNKQEDVHLRAVTLQAKEKMCPQDVMLCHPSFCPLLEQYSQKMNDGSIVRTVLETGNLIPEAILAAGLEYGVCPFELSLDLTLHADLVIGDYNYVFDPRVALKRFFAAGNSYDNLILIVDEAHNLLARGRDYYSPSLNWDAVQEVLAISEREHFDVFSELGHIYQQIDAIFRSLNRQSGNKLNKFNKALIELPRQQIRKLAEELGEKMLNYFMFKKQTQLFLARDPIDTFYYRFTNFAQVLQMEGEEFSYLLDGASADISLQILCHDPAAELHRRIAGFHSTICISATLEPMDFYRDVLGFEADAITKSFPSPFPPEHRRIAIVPAPSTRYQHREAAYPLIAELIQDTVSCREGNYAVFFPSFYFLQQVAECLYLPDTNVIIQRSKMREDERTAVLQQLEVAEEPCLLMAVQGGIFAEGVDYPGNMLIGAIIVSPALPGYSFEQELMKNYYDETRGKGFAYAYLFPGMNRVIQAAGRVIRTPDDHGVIVLVGQCFSTRYYNQYLPAHWYAHSPAELIVGDLHNELSQFWK